MLATPNLDTAKRGQKRQNSDFQPGRGGGRGSAKVAAKFAAKFCGKMFVLVLHIFHPQKNVCHRPCTANVTAALSKKIWSVTAYFVRGLRKRIQGIPPPGSEAGRCARDRREDAEFSGSGVGARERIVSGASVESA